MNDRIRQLAEQAGLIADQDTKEGWQEYINDVEKFAELIIRECITVADEYQNWPIRAIKEHFGVEK